MFTCATWWNRQCLSAQWYLYSQGEGVLKPSHFTIIRHVEGASPKILG